MRKRTRILAGILVLLAVVAALFFFFRSRRQEPAIEAFSSQLYTQEDYDAAVRLVKRQFKPLDKRTLLRISYAGDGKALSEQDYILAFGDYTEGIVLYSDFYVPKHGADGCWNPDSTYRNFAWYLARKNGGLWTVVTAGYG